MTLPFVAKLFKGWTMRGWYLSSDEDTSSEDTSTDDTTGSDEESGDDSGSSEGDDGDDNGDDDESGGDDEDPDIEGGGDEDNEDEGVASAESASDVKSAINDSTVDTISLSSDITYEQGLNSELRNYNETVLKNSSDSKTLELNGYSITGPSDNSTINDVAIMCIGGELIINGTSDSEINGGSGSKCNAAVVAQNEGVKVTINGGTYDVGLDANDGVNATIYASDGATIEIYDGYFKNTGGESINDTSYLLNINNDQTAKIVVYGGQFEDFDPSIGDNSSGAAFVADGYTVTSEKSGDHTIYTVVAA